MDEVRTHQARERRVTRFSIVGYSLGGLLARYVIGYALSSLLQTRRMTDGHGYYQHPTPE